MTQKVFSRQGIIAVLFSVFLVIAALFSAFYLAPKLSDPENRLDSIQYLDSKRNTVLTLATSSTAASAALSLLPDDVATPIADELAELSVYFMIITAAIVLEKYLITVSGLIVFQYIIPFVALLIIAHIWLPVELDKLALKLFVFGMLIFFIVPASVQVCQLIEDTYDTSINAAIESATETAQLINNSSEEEKNLIAKFLTGAKETISTAFNAVKNILNNFIEAVAIMLVTSCVVPILIVSVFVWAINALFGLNIHIPKARIKISLKNRKISLPAKTE